MNMRKAVLSICIPTYNRKNVILPDVKRYLSIKDDRIIIKVNDNKSTDGTVEELRKICDKRLVVNENSKNLGGLINGTLSLKGASSDYIMYIIDKDTIDTALLVEFVDYLEKKRPDFGYVDLANNKRRHIETFKAGKEAILKIAYKSKHPSGYFWRTTLFETELEQDYFKRTDQNFEFLFDLMAGSLAAKYDATIVYWPLVINANLRKTPQEEYKKSYTYNESNIYFGFKKRFIAYRIYLTHFLTLDIDNKIKKSICKIITDDCISKVTIVLKRSCSNRSLCEHYNMPLKKISFFCMLTNMINVLKEHRHLTKKIDSFPVLTFLYLSIKGILRIIIYYFKLSIGKIDTVTVKA